MDRLLKQAASEVRSGGRESLSSERAPMDGREFSLKTPQSGSSSNSRSSSPPPPIAAGGQKGGGRSGSGDDGGGLQVRISNKDGGGTDDAHERGTLPPQALREEGQDAASGRGGTKNGEEIRSEEGSKAEHADRLGQGKAPKVAGGKLENEDHGGLSGKIKGGGDYDAKIGSEEAQTLGQKEKECPPRTGGGEMRVVEVTDLFRTIKGLKCSLGEAYTCCFGRTEEVRTVRHVQMLLLASPHRSMNIHPVARANVITT